MATPLKSKPGLTGATALSIPKTWDPKWFRGFISNMLKGADVRNAIGVDGITITGNISSPYATIGFTGAPSANVTPDTHPASPNTSNDEFEFGSSLDLTGARGAGAVAWSWLNQGVSTANVTSGALVLNAATGGISSVAIVEQSIVNPSAAWDFRCKLLGIDWYNVQTGSDSRGGMWVGDNTGGGGLSYTMSSYYDSGAGYLRWNVARWSSPTTAVSALFTSSTSSSVLLDQWAGVMPMTSNGQAVYYRITFDGTTLRWYVSQDGVVYALATQEAVGAYLITNPAGIGLFASEANNSAQQASAVFDWFRRYA
jgi:hypothetical protein